MKIFYNQNSKNSGQKPILVFDLVGITSIFNRDIIELLHGGRHGQYLKTIDDLFQRLSGIAELVFYEDGPVVEEKYDTWAKRQNDKFDHSLRVFDHIYRGVPLSSIVAITKCIPVVATHIELISTKAKEYGKVIVSEAKECDGELAKFASTNSSVIAVLADDSDFLIFPGNFQYWSIAQLDLKTLSTMEFSRTALRQYLRLNDEQLVVLSTIAGNDIIKYDEVRLNHERNFGHHTTSKFPGIARFIREQINICDLNETLFRLADFLFQRTSEQTQRHIHDSFSQL